MPGHERAFKPEQGGFFTPMELDGDASKID
jgi:hypothetical protein